MSKSYTYRIIVNGYGGEISVGEVEKATYNYFQENEIDIDAYYYDWDNELNIPEEHQFVQPGCFYDCSSVAHESGCEIDPSNEIIIYDEDEKVFWSNGLNIEEIIKEGITVEKRTLFDRDSELSGSCFYVGQSIEKGNFIDWEFNIAEPLDLKKLTLIVEKIDGLELLTHIRYGDEDMNNYGPDTDGKAFEQELFMIGE
jgi:leucine-rich repeat protein SHOC2